MEEEAGRGNANLRPFIPGFEQFHARSSPAEWIITGGASASSRGRPGGGFTREVAVFDRERCCVKEVSMFDEWIGDREVFDGLGVFLWGG